eukprot:349777-Chlamydomonas_euryale.AAC.5
MQTGCELNSQKGQGGGEHHGGYQLGTLHAAAVQLSDPSPAGILKRPAPQRAAAAHLGPVVDGEYDLRDAGGLECLNLRRAARACTAHGRRTGRGAAF